MQQVIGTLGICEEIRLEGGGDEDERMKIEGRGETN